MARAKPPAPITPYLADLAHDDYRVRREAIKQLAKTRNPDAVPYLIAQLRDKTVNVRLDVIRACGKFNDPRVIAPLIDQLAHESCKIHGAAYDEVLKLGAAAIPALIEALGARNRYVRGGAAGLLGTLRAAEAVEPLIARLDESDPYVLMCVCNALGALHDPRAIAPLWALVERGPAHISQQPVRHMGTVGPARVIQNALISLVLLREIDAFYRLVDGPRTWYSLMNLLYALAEKAARGDDTARAMVTWCAEHHDPDVRAMGQKALESIG